MEEERRVAYVGVTRPRKALLVTSANEELSPFVREFFLNPKFVSSSEHELVDRLDSLRVKKNVYTVNLKQINEKLKELEKKYPELKGEYVRINGFLKRIKQRIRQVEVNEALKKHEQYNDQKKDIYNNKRPVDNDAREIRKELKFREIIKKGNQKIVKPAKREPLGKPSGSVGNLINDVSYKGNESEINIKNNFINEVPVVDKVIDNECLEEKKAHPTNNFIEGGKIQRAELAIGKSTPSEEIVAKKNALSRSPKTLENAKNQNDIESKVYGNSKKINDSLKVGKRVKNERYGIGTIVSNDLENVIIIFDSGDQVEYRYERLLKCIKPPKKKDSITKLKKISDEKFLNKDYGKEALYINQKIIEKGCNSTKYYLRLGECYKNQNLIEEAIEIYKLILKIDKKNNEALDFLEIYGKGTYYKYQDKPYHDVYRDVGSPPVEEVLKWYRKQNK